MTLDAWKFKNPALTVRYEREKQPCAGCKWLGKVFDLPFCTHGLIMKFGCKRYKRAEK